MAAPDRQPHSDPARANAAEADAAPRRDVVPPSRDELLAEVLGETLSRQREDPGELVEALRHWKASLAEATLERDRFAELVDRVLWHRLGEKAGKLPDRLRTEVGDALWNDPASRQRIEQLWNRLEVPR